MGIMYLFASVHGGDSKKMYSEDLILEVSTSAPSLPLYKFTLRVEAPLFGTTLD